MTEEGNLRQRIIEATGDYSCWDKHLGWDVLKELNALVAQVEAMKTALECANAAISDAIYLDDGLDGDTGTRVKSIIVEALEHGTFDAPGEMSDFLTMRERQTQEGIQRLEQRLAAATAEKDAVHALILKLFGKCNRDDSQPLSDLIESIYKDTLASQALVTWLKEGVRWHGHDEDCAYSYNRQRIEGLLPECHCGYDDWLAREPQEGT